MIPIFLDQLSPFAIAERDQDQGPLPLFPVQSNDHTSFSYIFSCNTQNQAAGVHTEDRQQIHYQLEHQKIESSEVMIKGLITDQGPNHHQALPFQTTNKNEVDSGNAQLVIQKDEHDKARQSHGSVKWMSSKMRFMRKMMGSSDQSNVIKRRSRCTQPHQDHQPNQENSISSSNPNNSQGIIRVCSDCNTTKTPLWRSGPQGPKSLCNACGIRRRKARSAMAAAAAMSAGLVPLETPNMNKTQKDKRSLGEDRTLPFKKRCKIVNAGGTGRSQKKKHCLDEFTVRLSKSSAFHQVFPQDERDAAILLMTLSCGLNHS